jgi:hypothetical protein
MSYFEFGPIPNLTDEEEEALNGRIAATIDAYLTEIGKAPTWHCPACDFVEFEEESLRNHMRAMRDDPQHLEGDAP